MKWNRIQTTEAQPWQEVPLPVTQGEENLWLTGEEFQTVEGFGCCFNELGWIALAKLSEEKREKVLELVFGERGLDFSFCRLPIGASDYAAKWYSHNETDGDFGMEHFTVEQDEKYLLPFLRAAAAHRGGMKLFASPWSPPTWMKHPQAHNYGTLVWEEEYLKAYALYFVKFIRAYEEKGISIAQVHVQNEPVSTQKFPSCIWTGEQMGEFIARYLGPAFREHGIAADIWLGTLNGQETDHRLLYTGFDQYANAAMTYPGAAEYIKGISYQWAGKNSIHQTVASFPELSYMQSENECGDGENSWEYAQYVFTLMWRYFSAGVSSYIYWNMALEQGGESTWGWKQNSLVCVTDTGEVVWNPEFYLMRHFSQFVKPGAVRLGVKGVFAGTALAFRNTDGSRVLVVQNGLSRERELVLSVDGQKYSAVCAANSWNTVVLG